jgi:muramidase (phage lysozyme)
MSPNLKAFLDMIATSEIGPKLLASSDNGYNVIVGGLLFDDKGTPDNLFDDYADHPRKIVSLGRGLKSSAAGRYQILARYYDFYKQLLGLHDFSPASQDVIATQLIKEQKALPDVEAGHFDAAVKKCANIWASLPEAGYGQHENTLAYLREAYTKAGGVLNG